MNKISCSYQYNHLSITQPEGKITPCCHFSTEKHVHWDQVNINTINSLTHLHQSYRWFDLRESLYEGVQYEGCENCWIAEDLGYESKRQYYNKIFENSRKNYVIEDLEIAFDFSCNFMCRTCRPGISSTWSKSFGVINELKKIDKNHYEPLSTIKYKDKIKNILENTDLTNLKRLAVVGGEPILSPGLRYFLQNIELSNLELKITTNGSIFPDVELLNLLNKCKKVYIDISIDAVGKLAEVMRYGAPWKMITNNIQKYLKTDFVIKFCSLISIMNVNKMNDVLSYSRELNVPNTCYYLNWPKHLRSNIFPLDMRRKWKINMPENESILFFMGYHHNHNAVREFNSIILNENTSENLLLEFVKSMLILDEYQSLKFSNVNPEIWELALTCQRVKNFFSENDIKV